MKAKLTLNGKEYEIELTEEKVAEIENSDNNETGFEGGGFGTEYCVSNFLADDEEEPFFSDEKLCRDYVRAVNLFLRISRFQAKHDYPVKKDAPYAYTFNFNKSTNEFYVYETGYPHYKFMEIAFSRPKMAQQVIDVFKDELIWYFTEFKPRLDM